MEEDYLSHHGIKGQKWGVEHGPPYPVRRGTGGKPKTTSIVKSKLKAVADKRNERAEKKKKAKHERLKERVIDHPRRLYKYRKEFSDSEINDIIKRIDMNKRMKDVGYNDTEVGVKKYDQLARVAKSTLAIYTTAKVVGAVLKNRE